jgi:hypothetical protein
MVKLEMPIDLSCQIDEAHMMGRTLPPIGPRRVYQESRSRLDRASREANFCRDYRCDIVQLKAVPLWPS